MGHKKDVAVFSDEHFEFGLKDGLPYLKAGGETFKLSCHPYEPCLYITDGDGTKTAVHNSFDPLSVIHAFRDGQTVTSITGFEYDALDFCRMVEYAAGMYDVQIDEAEKVFGGRSKRENPKPEKKEEKEKTPGGGDVRRFDLDLIIEDKKVEDMLDRYPDLAVDYCLVKNEDGRGYSAHWMALVWACRKLFIDEDEETIWHYDVGKADGKQISVGEFFAPAAKNGEMNYRKAFLHPPYEPGYTDADFDRVNAVLFPNGTEYLQVFKWTTGWSEYFDEGHEWWGTLCITVYDKSLDRFVVILASATD